MKTVAREVQVLLVGGGNGLDNTPIANALDVTPAGKLRAPIASMAHMTLMTMILIDFMVDLRAGDLLPRSMLNVAQCAMLYAHIMHDQPFVSSTRKLRLINVLMRRAMVCQCLFADAQKKLIELCLKRCRR